jgi:DNA-binding GntR family transcriptional regulator
MIVRERLSADVHHELIQRIIKGEFIPGQRLKDTDLAEELGVSRTPIREALLRLEREGFLSSQKHLGFAVKRMEESEIQEVYPLVRLLECSALDSLPAPCPGKLERLATLTTMLKE